MTVLILLIFIQYVFTVENRYILQLYAQPTISGNSTFLQVNSVQSELDDCLYSNNYTFTNDKVYSKVFAGRSITIDAESDTNLLAQCPQIKKLWPLRTLSLPVPIEGGPVRPLQFFTHNMTGVHHAQTILGLSGKGIKSRFYLFLNSFLILSWNN